MNPGALNRKIYLQCRRSVAEIYNFDVKDMVDVMFKTDENGFYVDEWVTVACLWCTVTNISGKELIKADQDITNTYKRMKFRYKKYLNPTFYFDVTNDFRIIYNNSVWNITSIDDIKDRHQYMEVLVTRVESEWNVRP